MSTRQLEMERETLRMMNRVNNHSNRIYKEETEEDLLDIENMNATAYGIVFFAGMAGFICLADLAIGLMNILF
ncbi:MAG: hypothetical protein HUJ53_03830 [Holdemanella sp.]|nr:hypothetical protein [Holdemanella sp.]